MKKSSFNCLKLYTVSSFISLLGLLFSQISYAATCWDALKELRLVQDSQRPQIFEVVTFAGVPLSGVPIEGTNKELTVTANPMASSPTFIFASRDSRISRPGKSHIMFHEMANSLPGINDILASFLIGGWADRDVFFVSVKQSRGETEDFRLLRPIAQFVSDMIKKSAKNTEVELYVYDERLAVALFKSFQEELAFWLPRFKKDPDAVDEFASRFFRDDSVSKQHADTFKAWLRMPESHLVLDEFIGLKPQSYIRSEPNELLERGTAQLWLPGDGSLGKPSLAADVSLPWESAEMLGREEFLSYYPTNMDVIISMLHHILGKTTFGDTFQNRLRNNHEWNSFIGLFTDISLGAIHLIAGEGSEVSTLSKTKEGGMDSTTDETIVKPLHKKGNGRIVSIKLMLFPKGYKPKRPW